MGAGRWACGTILRTGDGGITWLKQDSANTHNLYALHFQKKIGWAAGSNGMMMRYERVIGLECADSSAL